MPSPKFFRVALEGATTDGRKIERSWIEQMAASFNPKLYGARVWLEHIRGITPDSPFRAYGDVLALEARDEDDGRLGLYAQIDPTPELVKLAKSRQKIYTSIEVNQRFADTGQAYLMGIAITDSPASLGTEVLAFSAQHPEANPFASRKQDPENLFTAAVETELDFETDDAPGLTTRVRELFATLKHRNGRTERQFSDAREAIELVVQHVGQLEHEVVGMKEQFNLMAELPSSLQQLQNELSELRTSLSGQPETLTRSRPLATGGDVQIVTDC